MEEQKTKEINKDWALIGLLVITILATFVITHFILTYDKCMC